MGPCAQCGATDSLEAHHLVPRCNGGGNGDTQILCHRCHSLPLRQAQGSGQRVELHRQAGVV
jgi:5-methylcytosine-specific restriction endonuclease McrA